jgi:predicted metal-dependent hydrolase
VCSSDLVRVAAHDLRRDCPVDIAQVEDARLGRVLSEQHDLAFERALIKGQCTCWSSCSRKKTISVNYKLLFLPPGLVRYVLVHELCHTAQLDHSPKFWKLVHAHEPRCRTLDRELNAAWRYVPAWVDRGS